MRRISVKLLSRLQGLVTESSEVYAQSDVQDALAKCLSAAQYAQVHATWAKHKADMP